jgi:hypothetical protein
MPPLLELHLLFPSPRTQAFRCSGIQVFRYSGTQAFRCSGIQVFRYSGIQAFRCSGIQVFRYSGIPVFRYSGIQVFRYSGIQAFRHSGIQVFRYSGIPVFRYSGIQSPPSFRPTALPPITTTTPSPAVVYLKSCSPCWKVSFRSVFPSFRLAWALKTMGASPLPI